MARNSRGNRPSAPRPASNIPITTTMSAPRLRAFLAALETRQSFRDALASHLGIPSTRARTQPAQLEVIAEKVGNVTQRRKDLVTLGRRCATTCFLLLRAHELTFLRDSAWRNGSPHGAWTLDQHDPSSPVVVARPGPSVANADLVPSILLRFVQETGSVEEAQDQETYLDVITHDVFFNAFFSRFPDDLVTSAMIASGNPGRATLLTVMEIGIEDLDVMHYILQWIYLQDSSLFLQELLGEGLSTHATRLTEYNYRNRSRHVPERLSATLAETTLRIVQNLPRTPQADSTLRRRLLLIDTVFQYADALGLEDETFWKTLSVAHRLVFDICAIRHQQALRARSSVQT